MAAVEPDDEAIRIFWAKAVRSLQYAALEVLIADNAFQLGYQALLQAATAVLDAAGYRTRGQGGGHHRNAFYAVAALGIPGLEDVDARTERVRKRRAMSVYDPADEATARDVADLLALADRVLPAAHHWIVETRPSLRETPAPLPTP